MHCKVFCGCPLSSSPNDGKSPTRAMGEKTCDIINTIMNIIITMVIISHYNIRSHPHHHLHRHRHHHYCRCLIVTVITTIITHTLTHSVIIIILRKNSRLHYDVTGFQCHKVPIVLMTIIQCGHCSYYNISNVLYSTWISHQVSIVERDRSCCFQVILWKYCFEQNFSTCSSNFYNICQCH